MKADMELRNYQLRQQILKERAMRQNADLVDIVDYSPDLVIDRPIVEEFPFPVKVEEAPVQLDVPMSERPTKYFVPVPLSAKLGNGRIKNLSLGLT